MGTTEGRKLPVAAVATLALTFGGLAAFATLRVLGEQTPLLSVPLARHTILDITAQEGGARVALSGGRSFFVDTATNPRNARNILLLHRGRQVTLRPSKAVLADLPDTCMPILPVMEASPPSLTPEDYHRLVAAGFSDAEIATAWTLPEGETNPNPAPAADGVAARYAGILCAESPQPAF